MYTHYTLHKVDVHMQYRALNVPGWLFASVVVNCFTSHSTLQYIKIILKWPYIKPWQVYISQRLTVARRNVLSRHSKSLKVLFLTTGKKSYPWEVDPAKSFSHEILFNIFFPSLHLFSFSVVDVYLTICLSICLHVGFNNHVFDRQKNLTILFSACTFSLSLPYVSSLLSLCLSVCLSASLTVLACDCLPSLYFWLSVTLSVC